MFKKISCHIKGLSPLLMHNVRLANPLDDFAKNIKKFSSKKTKVDSDYEEMSRLEWFGGLYLKDGKPCIPGECVEGCIRDSAKKTRRGKEVTRGVVSDGSWPLIYPGPKDLEKLYEDKSYVDFRSVKIGGKRIMRTRPIFHVWELKFDLNVDTLVFTVEEIADILVTANDIGLCDYRPKFGRFEVV